MTAKIRTRFAPSPTGYMHIGNLRTALYEYLIAKRGNGKFILRIEDTDRERFVEGAEDVIYKTLKTAGLQHDEGPDVGGEFGPYIQSQRKPIYMEHAKKLVELDEAYYCFCTKERLQDLKEKHDYAKIKVPYKYDRFCMNIGKEEAEKRVLAGEPFVIRQKMPDKGTTSFEDVVYGTITVDNSILEDQILLKSDGLPTYNFANVVDDHLMGITHVVRGNEYLSSTPKYNLLYKAFGWEIPVYIHVPMILKEDGGKLSKRAGDPSFEDLMSMGYLVDAIINYVALLGWSPGDDREIFSMAELTEAFDVKGIGRSPAVFDMAKLNWINGEYIRKMDQEDFHTVAEPYYKGVIRDTSIDLRKVSKLLQVRTEVLNTIPEYVNFFDRLPDYDISMYVHKKMKTTEEIALDSLVSACETLEGTEPWDENTIHERLMALVQEKGIKNGQMLWPIRTAISGKQITPGGAIEIAHILGREETLKRLRIGIDKLKMK